MCFRKFLLRSIVWFVLVINCIYIIAKQVNLIKYHSNLIFRISVILVIILLTGKSFLQIIYSICVKFILSVRWTLLVLRQHLMLIYIKTCLTRWLNNFLWRFFRNYLRIFYFHNGTLFRVWFWLVFCFARQFLQCDRIFIRLIRILIVLATFQTFTFYRHCL